MADEIDMLEEAEFENQINAIGDDSTALTKFVAWQQFRASKVMLSHGKRIRKLEQANRKTFGIVGAVAAILATAVVAAIDYLLKRS